MSWRLATRFFNEPYRDAGTVDVRGYRAGLRAPARLVLLIPNLGGGAGLLANAPFLDHHKRAGRLPGSQGFGARLGNTDRSGEPRPGRRASGFGTGLGRGGSGPA